MTRLAAIALVGLTALAIGGYQWLAIGLCESDCASATARDVWGAIAATGALSAALAIGALVVRAIERGPSSSASGSDESTR